MKNNLEVLIKESIDLELNISKLYMLFCKLFAEDADFWWQLSIEEQNHASILKAGLKYFLPMNKFPQNLIPDQINILIDQNNNINDLIDKYSRNPPSRDEAFNIALEMEKTAGEFHYQMIMDENDNDFEIKIFRDLNSDDKDHYERIQRYMYQKNISIYNE